MGVWRGENTEVILNVFSTHWKFKIFWLLYETEFTYEGIQFLHILGEVAFALRVDLTITFESISSYKFTPAFDNLL